MVPQDYKELMGEGKLYEAETLLKEEDIFKNPLWHPGKITEKYFYCFIHGLNLFVGGALFDTAEKFSELYAERTKKAKNFALHDLKLKGVSFLNLQWVLYNKSIEKWYSPELFA